MSYLYTQGQLSFFGHEGQAYTGTDGFIYYRQGNRSKFVAPDVFVVFGVDVILARNSFYAWAGGHSGGCLCVSL